MSITRSPVPPAPATDAAAPALLLVGHGAVRPGAGLLLRRYARVLGRRLAGPVAAGAVYGAPALTPALRRLAGRDVAVLPLVMCNDDLVVAAVSAAAAELPVSTRPRSIRFAAPIGMDAGVADVVERAALKACAARGWAPAGTRLVLVAHGSPRRPASRRMAAAHAGAVGSHGVFGAVCTAFLEEAPALADVLRHAAGPVVVVGLFLGGGRHAEVDVVAALAGRRDVAYVGAVGELPAFVERLAAASEAVAGRERALPA